MRLNRALTPTGYAKTTKWARSGPPLTHGLRHAALRRADLGDYTIEVFCQLTDYALVLTTGVREAECLGLRRRWGKDTVRPA